MIPKRITGESGEEWPNRSTYPMPAAKFKTSINFGSQTGCQFFNKSHTYLDKTLCCKLSLSLCHMVCQFVPTATRPGQLGYVGIGSIPSPVAPAAFGIKLHPLRMNFDEDIQDTLRPSEKQRRKNFPLATKIYQ